MFTFIAFLLTLTGAANWLMIGLMQYDFIAGIFGWQGSMMSRLIYVLFGFGAAYLLIRVIVNKGSVKVWERKNKKEKKEKGKSPSAQENSLANSNFEINKKKKPGFFARLFKKKNKEEPQQETTLVQPAFAETEASKEFVASPAEESPKAETTSPVQSDSNSLFDEHFK